MNPVHLIAAVGQRGQLGLGGRLPWRDPEDLRWFQQMTTGGIVVMGGRTYDAVAPRLQTHGRFLFRFGHGVKPAAALRSLSNFCDDVDRVIWIAGGAQTYRAFLPFVRRSFLTHIDYDGEADVFMPPLWEQPCSNITISSIAS